MTNENWDSYTSSSKFYFGATRFYTVCYICDDINGNVKAFDLRNDPSQLVKLENGEFEEFLHEEEAREILRESPGLIVLDKRELGGYITPVECVGDYATFVSRVRQDNTIENGLNLWCVSDNLRKGAALNAVQIAELLCRKCLE